MTNWMGPVFKWKFHNMYVLFHNEDKQKWITRVLIGNQFYD